VGGDDEEMGPKAP